MGKIKLKLRLAIQSRNVTRVREAPTRPRIRCMWCFDLTHAPVATTARAAATEPVSMSTRPDPEGSATVEITLFKLDPL